MEQQRVREVQAEPGTVIEYTNWQGSRVVALLDKYGTWNVLCFASPGHVHHFQWSQDELSFDMRDAAPARREASAWDEGFTACAQQHMKQQQDPSHPITRTNPYGAGLNGQQQPVGIARDELAKELAAIIRREYIRAIDRKRLRDCYTAPADAILAAGYVKQDDYAPR